MNYINVVIYLMVVVCFILLVFFVIFAIERRRKRIIIPFRIAQVILIASIITGIIGICILFPYYLNYRFHIIGK